MGAEEWKVSLPSWRDGSARRSVIAFLQETTQGPGALPVADRVAAFDNDGTLACEKPHTALAGFLLDRLAAAGWPLASLDALVDLAEQGLVARDPILRIHRLPPRIRRHVIRTERYLEPWAAGFGSQHAPGRRA